MILSLLQWDNIITVIKDDCRGKWPENLPKSEILPIHKDKVAYILFHTYDAFNFHAKEMYLELIFFL